MPKIFNKRIRRRHAKKAVWLVISIVATLGLVLSALAPALRNF